MAGPRNPGGRPPSGQRPPEDEDVTHSGDTTFVPGLIEGDDELTGVSRAPAEAAFDVDVEVFVAPLARPPLSGAYAPIVQAERSASWSAPAPVPDEEDPGPLFEPLPEMSADIWQAGVRALVSVPEEIAPPPHDEAYWRDLGGLLVDELALTEEPAARAELMLSASRVAELLADGAMALRLVDDVLGLAPDAPEAWRARARLLEGGGDFEGAHEAWRQLRARVPDDEAPAYTALDGEWTLARRGSLDGLEGPSLDAVPDGPARALAEAEMALLRGTPSEVAGALEQAAFGAGGAPGAALLEAAARFHEVSGDAAAAAEQRFVAARMDAGNAAPPLGRLRDAARLPPAEAEAALSELRADLPPSALAAAVARWSASLARARGDVTLARDLLSGPIAGEGAPLSAALLRDRIDLALELGAPFDEETRAAAMAAATTPVAFALASLREATSAALAGDAVASLDRLAEGTAALPDALPLGLLAEDLSRADVDAASRERALALWLGADPARRAPAALALADTIDARGDADAELAARAALQTAIEAAPGAAIFWSIAARDARAGRTGDAAATLAFGAEAWSGSRLGAPLSERAAELAALAAPGAALPQLHGLATPGAAELERLLTIARTVVRDAPSADQHAWLTDQVSVFTDLRTRAAWWLRRAQALPPDSGDERPSCLDAALEKAPAHPVALALLLGDPAVSPAHAATALATAAAATDRPAFRYAAAQLAALAEQRSAARDLAAELVTAVPAPAAVELMVELARLAGGAVAAAGFVARLSPAAGDAAQALRVSEALETLGESARAVSALERLSGGPLDADARRAGARLEGRSPGAGLPLELFAAPDDEEAARATEALANLRRAAEQARAGDVVWALEHEPPAESAPLPDALFFAGLASADARGASALFARAFEEGGADGRLEWATRAAETAADAALAARAFERAASLSGGGVGAAAFLRAAAAEHARAGDADATARCLRAAVAADPEHLPSLTALRRASAAARDLGATIEACAWEARVVRDPAARVAGLLRAAELARFEAPAVEGGAPARAVALFREALEIEPANEAAFAGLRALLEAGAEGAALAEALAARILVARNPFEITALRLARAELLAGPLSDRAGAKAELETILHKEPQHARALARLSDLEFEDGAFAAAGELYLRRALVERAPDVLRETLLRLGRIYTKHVPDAKRAVGAYARVLQTEADNHEALAALSDLYVETGDTKNALAVTEALIPRETEPARKLAALVRCGQLHEKAGDLRHAGARFRQAADAAPRDLTAVTELARFLERARDPVGRRALLDHSVGLLRHDVERGRFDVTTLRTLVPLLQARGRVRAAAAAAQVLAALGDDPTAVRTWAAPPPRGRRLAALARPEVDERSFPPALLPGMRHVFRLVGPLLAKGQPDLARHGLAKNDRLPRGQAARDVADGVAVELGVADVDVFVRAAKPAGAALGPVRVEPGDRAALIIGAEVLALGGHALRFAAARGLRLVATHLDLVLAGTPEQAGALLGGVIRQFVPEFRHAEVRDILLEPEAERVAKLLPRKLKPEVMPFAIESAGAFSLEALHAAVRDGANAVGLLACGDLAAALAVVVSGTSPSLALGELAAHPEALALLRFALSDDYDEMAEAME
jgi:lipopolysaccharide biosynthesis regulator YciM